MENLNTVINPDIMQKIIAEYYRFERKKQFKKLPIKFIFGFLGFIILIGFITNITLLMSIGLTSLAVITLFFSYVLLKFEFAKNKALASFNKKPNLTDANHQFSFNETELIYTSQLSYSIVKWEMIHDYAINGTELYLYMIDNELFDIYSPKLMGEVEFNAFKTLVIRKFQK